MDIKIVDIETLIKEELNKLLDIDEDEIAFMVSEAKLEDLRRMTVTICNWCSRNILFCEKIYLQECGREKHVCQSCAKESERNGCILFKLHN